MAEFIKINPIGECVVVLNIEDIRKVQEENILNSGDGKGWQKRVVITDREDCRYIIEDAMDSMLSLLNIVNIPIIIDTINPERPSFEPDFINESKG